MRKVLIKDKDYILAVVLRKGIFPKGLGFYTNDDQPIQVATWRYEKGKDLLAHIHKKARRSNAHVQELLFVKSGKLRADLYNENHEKVKSVILKEGDILINFKGGHGYTVLQDNTQVLEVKNGPYIGIEKDKLVITPKT